MAARAIGSANIAFGLVSIPVKVYSSSESGSGISFNMLEEKTGARVKQQYISSQTGEVVARDEMIKGYEFAKGQYVTFTSDELKSFETEANKAVEIQEFVPISKVDPIYLEKAYYLGPDKGGERPYMLLRAAMEKTKRAALAKYAARGKQYLVLVRPMGEGIVMQQLRYAHEIRSISDVPLGDGKVNANELKLAVQLVEQIASNEFLPENYEDEVKQRIEEAIARKVEGKEVTAEPTQEPRARIIDLMEALKTSLGEKKKTARKPAKKAPRKVAAKKRKAAEG
ncbi:MAG: Ku protein [Planctomycetota bacterium]|jgi:DNA end-binding protein Ku|nr:Ku protein [Planctomycetota bacterium]